MNSNVRCPHCRDCPHHSHREVRQQGNSVEAWKGNRGFRVVGNFAIVVAVLGVAAIALIQRMPLPPTSTAPPITVLIV